MLELNKEYPRSPKPIPLAAVKLFRKCYARGGRIMDVLYPLDYFRVLDRVRSDSVAWQNYKKCVKWLEFASSYVYPDMLNFDDTRCKAFWRVELLRALEKMSHVATCPRWSQFEDYFEVPERYRDHFKRTYCKRHNKDAW